MLRVCVCMYVCMYVMCVCVCVGHHHPATNICRECTAHREMCQVKWTSSVDCGDIKVLTLYETIQ